MFSGKKSKWARVLFNCTLAHFLYVPIARRLPVWYFHKKVMNYYLQSGDYNGLPSRVLWGYKGSWVRRILRQVAKRTDLFLVSDSSSANPYINREYERETRSVLKDLETANLTHCVLYPRKLLASRLVNKNNYSDKPWDLELAMGRPQLEIEFFSIDVLERYRNDPRFFYVFDDIRGYVGLGTESSGWGDVHEWDDVHLRTFGMGYDSDKRPVIAVFLRYLAELTPEHQQHWHSRRLYTECKVHTDYYQNNVTGEWGEYISVYSAILEEISIINSMCADIGWKPLFTNDYSNDRPPHLSALLRPTKKEFYDFALGLDKILSDNINYKFFEKKVGRTETITRKDGSLEIRYKGSLQMLGEWLEKSFVTNDNSPILDAMACFKDVRKLRQKPAHSIDDNVFNVQYHDLQRELVFRVYKSIRLLRLLLANHPKAKAIKIPETVRTGERIWPL